MGQSILSKETTQWQGGGVEPPTFRTEVQRTNHYTTAPPPKHQEDLGIFGLKAHLHDRKKWNGLGKK